MRPLCRQHLIAEGLLDEEQAQAIMAQLAGRREFDVLVSFAPGHYYFQCDPHALLGMVGELEVEDEN